MSSLTICFHNNFNAGSMPTGFSSTGVVKVDSFTGDGLRSLEPVLTTLLTVEPGCTDGLLAILDFLGDGSTISTTGAGGTGVSSGATTIGPSELLRRLLLFTFFTGAAGKNNSYLNPQ